YAGTVIKHFPIYLQIRNSEIMKRAKQIFFKRLLKTDLISNVMVKNRINIILIGIRTGGHSQPELWLKIPHNLLVTFSARMMTFIQNDHIKISGIIVRHDFLFRYHLHSRK